MTPADVFDLVFALTALFGIPIGNLAVAKVDERITGVVDSHIVVGQIDYVLVVQAVFVSLMNVLSSVVLTTSVDTMQDRIVGYVVIVLMVSGLLVMLNTKVSSFGNWPTLARYGIKLVPLAALGVRLWATHFTS